jgi:hypothetical protein
MLDGLRQASLELEIRADVDAVDGREERVASQGEHPVVDARAQWAQQRNLRAAPGVGAEARFGEIAESFSKDAGARREVRLYAVNRDRRLHEHVSHSGTERWRAFGLVFVSVGVLEFEPDDEQSGAEGEAARHSIGRRRRRAGEKGGICPRRRRAGQDEGADKERSDESHTE